MMPMIMMHNATSLFPALLLFHKLLCLPGDMWPNRDGDAEEPDWVKTEREQFETFRDKDSDGVMNRAEVSDWIQPTDYDHSIAEAKHLIFESDIDKVNYLYTLTLIK